MADTHLGSNASFETLLNFRDVASTINTSKKTSALKCGLLYRSARPDTASPSDHRRLVGQYGIKTVIDLRTTTEHLEAAKKYTGENESHEPSEAPPVSNEEASKPGRIPGLQYAEINLNGKGFERHLVWQLSYWNLAKLAGLMAFGYRVEGIGVLGKNVLLPKGLTGLARDTLDYSGPEIKQVFDVLSNEASYPVLVHCTQGKDRTGLIILLVLLLCGVGMDAISHDYMLSEHELAPEFEERMKEITSIGLDETFARCAPDFAVQTTQYIADKYGGIDCYLAGLGVTQSQFEAIRLLLKGIA